MGPRGAGRRLNDQERMEILEIIQREAKVKNVDLAKRYGVSEGAIRKLKQMQDTVRNRYYMGNEHNRDKRKRGGFQRNAPFEEELYQWIVRMRESQPYQLMPLTQTAVRQQAIVLAKNYDKMADFKASPGWFARFCSRHRLDPIVTNGDAAAAAAAAAASVQVAGDSNGTLVADSVSPGVAVSAAVVPSTTTADDSVYLLEALTESSPVTTSQTMEMESAATAAVLGGASDAEQGSKTGTPSINEQVQQAAREHNEAALRAAVAKIGEAQVSVETIKSKEEEEKVDVKIEVEGETEEEGGTEGSKDSDEMFSLGL
uniref:HTH CENPB-type domain-containing protein n=1 Tax=Peronospora matthiolae TaxID=2874970 RepID=A0AAV1UEH6_9STRA